MQACSWSGGGEEPGAGSAACRSWSCPLPGAGSGQDPRAARSWELWAGSGKESSAAGCLRQLATTFSVPHCTGPSHERRCFFHAGSCAGFATSVVHQICLFGIALLQNIEELSVCTAWLRPHSSSSNKNARTQAREAAMVIGRKVTSSVACKGSEEVWGHGQTKGRRHRQGS